MVLIYIAIGVLIISTAISFILGHFALIDAFRSGNVIVFGKKGKGKDLIFQYVTNHTRKKHLSNIYYNKKSLDLKISQLSLNPNTYTNLINDKIIKLQKNQSFEGLDAFISDAGVYLPSQCDSVLHKTYPSFPIYYALSRHLYNSNVHVNTQSLSRVWKALREQADSYIKVTSNTFFGPFVIVRFTLFDKYQSAENDVRPLPNHILKKDDSIRESFKASNGLIENHHIIMLKRSIHYDTRIFEKKFFSDLATK